VRRLIRCVADLHVHSDAGFSPDRENALDDDRSIARLQRPDVFLGGLEPVGEFAPGESGDMAALLQHPSQSLDALPRQSSNVRLQQCLSTFISPFRVNTHRGRKAWGSIS